MKRGFTAYSSNSSIENGPVKRGRTIGASVNTQRSLSGVQAAQVKRIVQREQELKFTGGNVTATAVTTTLSITGTLFDIAQGVAGQDQRVGDSINWCGHIDLRLQVVNSTDQSNSVRIAIIQWFPNQVPVAADIFHVGPGGSISYLSHYNHARRRDFMVLFDKTFRTVGAGTSGILPVVENRSTGVLDFNIPLTKARKNVQYDAAAITGTNRLYILRISDSATGPTVAYSLKVVFRDG